MALNFSAFGETKDSSLNLSAFRGTNYDPLSPSQTRKNADGTGAISGIKIDNSMIAVPRKKNSNEAMLRLGTVLDIPGVGLRIVADLKNTRYDGENWIDFANVGSGSEIIPKYNKTFDGIKIVRQGNGYEDARNFINSGEWKKMQEQYIPKSPIDLGLKTSQNTALTTSSISSSPSKGFGILEKISSLVEPIIRKVTDTQDTFKARVGEGMTPAQTETANKTISDIAQYTEKNAQPSILNFDYKNNQTSGKISLDDAIKVLGYNVSRAAEIKNTGKSDKPAVDPELTKMAFSQINDLVMGVTGGGMENVGNKSPAGKVVNNLIEEARKYKTAEEFVNNKINVFHATNEAQSKSIESVGFKPSLGRGFSNQPGDFAYFTPSVDGAIRYSKTSANGLNKITSGHLKGNILKIDGVVADFEAFGKAQEKLGVPLGIGPQGKPTMLDIDGLKKALRENGYSAIEFKDRYSNGARAIAAIPEDVVTKSQLTDIWKEANKKSVSLSKTLSKKLDPEIELSKANELRKKIEDAKFFDRTLKEQKAVEARAKIATEARVLSEADRLIAENKIRVVSRDGRDIYQVKKGGEWVNARDESSAIAQVTKTPTVKELPQSIQEKKIQLDILRENLANNPAKELSKYVSKTGDYAGGLKEVTGNDTSLFGSKGDDIVTELGFKDTEQAREAYNSYLKQKKATADLKAEILDEIKILRTAKQKEAQLSGQAPAKQSPETKQFFDQASGQKKIVSSKIDMAKEEAISLENLAQESLSRLDPVYREEVSSLSKMIVDTSTSVKQKVGAIDYWRTPDRVLNKIGLNEASEALRKGYDDYLRELPEHLKVITNWSKEVPKESNIKIFKSLDGEKIDLNSVELRVKNEIKDYLAEWSDRLDLPEDNKISHYITHVFDMDSVTKEFDEDIAKIIKNKVPGSVYDPFLEKRLGAKGYVQDTWRALDAYVKRAVRKANMDPALEILKRDSAKLEDSQLEYVTSLGARINMRPTKWDNLLDNTIKQLIGYRFGQRPTAVISGTLRKMVYRGALGLNISSAVKNLTQGVNTFAKLGVRDTLIGYIKALTPGMSKELEAVGVLKEGFIQDRTLSSTRQILQKIDKGLFMMFETAEKINRGSAYFGAKAKAMRGGMDELKAIEYAKKVVRDTQFVFGSIDTPVAMQGDIAKTIFQFGSFSQKQTEFLAEMIKNKEFAGLIRYALASMAIVYTVGEVFNIKGKDFNPLNYFSRFGKPPALALPIEVIKTVTNMPDQYGRTPSAKTRVKNLIYSGTTLVPAGVQISKTLKGNTLSSSKSSTKTKPTPQKTSGIPSIKIPKIMIPKMKIDIPKIKI